MVIMFISADCPLSQLYAKPFTALKDSFPDFHFMGIVPGQFEDLEAIEAFKTDFGFGPEIYRDPEYNFSRMLQAEVTPEFFVISPDKDILYHGAMDDWAIDLAKKKVAPKNHYLMDALHDISAGNTVNLPKTIPVGCIIEYGEE